MDIKTATAQFEQLVEKELDKWQNETIFDKTFLPDNFHELVNEVFHFNSPFNLRMTIDFYKQIVTEKENEYTLMEISCICHAAKIRNAHELGVDMDEYLQIQEGIESIAKEYLKIIEGKRESIIRKLQATLRAEQTVPDSHKTINLPVIGEA